MGNGTNVSLAGAAFVTYVRAHQAGIGFGYLMVVAGASMSLLICIAGRYNDGDSAGTPSSPKKEKKKKKEKEDESKEVDEEVKNPVDNGFEIEVVPEGWTKHYDRT